MKKESKKESQPIDIVALDQRIKNELGVDISKYNNPRIADSLIELLSFPNYIRSWVIRPIFLSIMAYIIGFFIFDLTRFDYVIYPIFGLLLFLSTGILTAALLLTLKLKSNIWEVIEFTLGILRSSVEDLHQVGTQTDLKNSKEVLGLLFTGIVHIIIVPILAKDVAGRIPVIGRFMTRFVTKVITRVAGNLNFESPSADLDFDDASDGARMIEVYTGSINSIINGTSRALNVTVGIAQFPLLLGFVVSATFLGTLIYFVGGA